MLNGFVLGIATAFILVVLGFLWGMSGRSLVGLLTPWLGKLNAVWVYAPRLVALLPRLGGELVKLLKLLKVMK